MRGVKIVLFVVLYAFIYNMHITTYIRIQSQMEDIHNTTDSTLYSIGFVPCVSNNINKNNKIQNTPWTFKCVCVCVLWQFRFDRSVGGIISCLSFYTFNGNGGWWWWGIVIIIDWIKILIVLMKKIIGCCFVVEWNEISWLVFFFFFFFASYERI